MVVPSAASSRLSHPAPTLRALLAPIRFAPISPTSAYALLPIITSFVFSTSTTTISRASLRLTISPSPKPASGTHPSPTFLVYTGPHFPIFSRTRRVPLEKPEDLARLLASYAREARARAETHPLAAFGAVKSALQDSLGITFEGDKGEHFFLSTLIQTLFYGIFSAWILWRATPEGRVPDALFNWRLSADYLRIPVLRQLFHAVSERGALNTVQIIEVLDHVTDALNRVQPGFFAVFNHRIKAEPLRTMSSATATSTSPSEAQGLVPTREPLPVRTGFLRHMHHLSLV